MTRKIKLIEWGDPLIGKIEKLLGSELINTMTFDHVINSIKEIYDIDDDRIDELRNEWWNIRYQ